MRERLEETLFRMAEEERMIMPVEMSDKIEEVLCKLNPKERHTSSIPGRAKEAGRPKGKGTGGGIFRLNFRKSLILAATLIMLVSATAAASVGALRERMEAMNREKIEAYYTQIYSTKIGSDNYNRPLTDTEKERMDALADAYEEEARFPKGEVTMLEEAADYRGRGVGFLGETTTFFLPEKEMSDEELLRIIDFRYRRDYSLAKMNALVAAGEAKEPEREAEPVEATEEEILMTDAVNNPRQALTIPYEGNLELDQAIAAGAHGIYLAGWNTVHRMEIGGSTSEPFFDEFGTETRVLAMCEDKNGDVYMALWQWEEGTGGDKPALAVWVVDRFGKLLRKIDLMPYISPQRQGYTRRMAIGGDGYLYMSVAGLRDSDSAQECEILVLDREGGYAARISSDEYAFNLSGGLGTGRDGRVYAFIENRYDPEDTARRMGIAALDAQKGTLGDIYFDIMPEGAVLIDLIAPGAESDFVFWGYDGIFTYDMGDGSAQNILPAYEAPCSWEGVRFCALYDGRIVFASCEAYRGEETPYGTRFYGIPEETYFYYVPGVKTE